MIATLLTASAAVLASPAAGVLGYRQLKRATYAKLLRITTPEGIDESGFVRVGGIEQWISIRGEDRRNPVVLEIHGGPGASNLVFAPRTRAWERHFTIVRWDMRGAGRTFGRGGPDGQGAMTFERICADALEVTEHLRTRLGVDKVVLVANSFGTVFGLHLARSHPELYAAYVGADQNILAGGRDHSTYEDVVDRLRKADKRKELATVTAMGADPSAWTARQRSDYNKITVTSDPLTYDTMKTVVMRSLWFSPLHTLGQLRQYLKGMNFSERITPQTAAVDEWADGTEFRLPFFLFHGELDVITPAGPARRFFDDVKAPVKDFTLVPGTSHFSSFRHPDRFLDLMVGKVRPAVTGEQAPR